MIHGHKKSKKEKSEKQQKQQAQLSLKINNKLAQFFSINRKDVAAHQIPKYLQFIALLMQLCTDIPTVFNFRRELIIKLKQEKSAQQIGQLLAGQVKLTTKLIQSDPKSYTIWSYRQWLVKSLFSINSNIIKTEMELIKMLLIKDEKNFHVWNYRNWLNSIQSNIDEDLIFTQSKIKSNPFNFSPYHFRTKFIHQKYTSVLTTEITQELRRQIITYGMPKQLFDEELDSVKTAIFLNPNEQAPWLYYNWILGQLIPAFIVFQQNNQNAKVLYFNMKVGNFQKHIECSHKAIGNAGKSNTEIWEIHTNDTSLRIRSNLQYYQNVDLESTSKLFLGNSGEALQIAQKIKSLIRQQIDFVQEVIQSQQKLCRFAYLQKASLLKLILQLGTTASQHTEVVSKGVDCLKSIEKEQKAQKYTLKQLQYWERLRKGQLSKVEEGLKNKWG